MDTTTYNHTMSDKWIWDKEFEDKRADKVKQQYNQMLLDTEELTTEYLEDLLNS